MSVPASAKTLTDYTRVLRRRWGYLAVIWPSLILLALFVAFVLPVTYQAVGTIMLEPPTIATSLVPNAVPQPKDSDQHAAQQLELTRRKVMDVEAEKALVKELNPYPNMSGATLTQKAQQLESDTTVQHVDPVTYLPLEDSNAFSLMYENPSPEKAKEVATRLVNMFLAYNQRVRAEQAAESYKFLQAQAQDLEAEMVGMEKQLAVFKAKYGDALPNAENRNIAGADRSQTYLDTLDRSILDAEQQEGLLQIQLSSTSPSLTASVGDWRTELAKARADLADAQQRYTPQHPDVRRLQRAVADLVAQGAASDSAQSAAPPDNPDYQHIKSQLDSTRHELTVLRTNRDRVRSQLSTYEKNLSTAPNVERDYLQLSRDYDNAQARYQDLQTKMKAAALNQQVESESRGERFTVLKMPLTPKRPFSPNRLGIILIGFVLGAVFSIGAAVLADMSDATVRGSDDLHDILEVEPIGAIPLLRNRADVRRRRWRWSTVGAGFAAAIAVVAVTILLSH